MKLDISGRGDARPRRSNGWTKAEDKRLELLWSLYGGRMKRIADFMGMTKGQISGRSRMLGLQFHGGRARVLEPGDRRMVAGISVFHNRVVEPDRRLGVLKWGDNQRKLGGKVTKGPWAGRPIYSLTLEERATCPPDCALLASCYGNNMGMAKRFKHGPALEKQLMVDLRRLHQKHYATGFVVRLHILGDFYSVDYVKFWDDAIAIFPTLYVFGYTAWQAGTPIGDAVARLRNEEWDRFAVRTSNAKSGPRTMVIKTVADLPQKAILCPAQTGKTKNCSSCSICWSAAATDRSVAFMEH